MKVHPFQYMAKRSLWKIPVDYALSYFNRDLVFAIDRVEVRWWVFSRKDADHDPKNLDNSGMSQSYP